MPKYLFQANYTAAGTKGLVSEGGTGRRNLIAHMCRELGGELESYYYAFGESDVYAVADLPDDITAASVTLAINQSGAVNLKTTVLLAPEDIDTAARKMTKYRAPGE
ncbi:MAG: GYD domain-containing protein [Rhodothermales bacterium]